MRRFSGFLLLLLAILTPGAAAHASFHFMQIEQVIGGVNGDTTAQAVQLRMRSAGQNLVAQSRLVVVDATGSNPILLDNMTTNVANGAGGARVLITTPNFANYTNIPLVTNFVMDPIPASYLAAGSLTFEDDFGTVYWRLSWGGSGYTGSNLGAAGINDADGNFGPPFAGPLPSTTLQALDFTGSASALSTSNSLQYVVTAGAATFINNTGTAFVVTAPEGLAGDHNGDGTVDAADYALWRSDPVAHGGDPQGYIDWADNFGATSGGSPVVVAAVPEPASWMALFAGTLLGLLRRRR
jgi:hypothetical protein